MEFWCPALATQAAAFHDLGRDLDDLGHDLGHDIDDLETVS